MRALLGLRECSALSALEGWCRKGTLELLFEEGCTGVTQSSTCLTGEALTRKGFQVFLLAELAVSVP